MERKGFGKYVTGKMKRFTPHKVYIFFMRITRRSAGDPDQEPASDPDQEFICFIGSESLLYTFQRILHLRVTGIKSLRVTGIKIYYE